MILSNKHIILTHCGKADCFQILKNFGATLHHFPMIDIISKSNIKPFNISDFDYYIFTSKNGVNSFVNLDFVKGKKINALCLGKKTKAALYENGIEPVFVSSESYAEDFVAELLKGQMISNKKVLLILGNLADNRIEAELSSICKVKRLDIYNTNLQTKKNKELIYLLNEKDTISIFTSPSSFLAFTSLYDAEKTTLATIGITTSKCIKSTGFKSKIISDKQTYDGISKAIINYYETKNISI